jgi:hypothetical protein
VTGNHDDERQETDHLDAKERKPNSHEGIGLHMGHVDQRLNDAGDRSGKTQSAFSRTGC